MICGVLAAACSSGYSLNQFRVIPTPLFRNLDCPRHSLSVARSPEEPLFNPKILPDQLFAKALKMASEKEKDSVEKTDKKREQEGETKSVWHKGGRSGEASQKDTLDGDWVVVLETGPSTEEFVMLENQREPREFPALQSATGYAEDFLKISCTSEWPGLSTSKGNDFKITKSPSNQPERTTEQKPRNKKKSKVKTVPLGELGFDFSFVSNERRFVSKVDEFDMERELSIFEESLICESAAETVSQSEEKEPETGRTSLVGHIVNIINRFNPVKKSKSNKIKCQQTIADGKRPIESGPNEKGPSGMRVGKNNKKQRLKKSIDDEVYGFKESSNLLFFEMSEGLDVLKHEGSIPIGTRLRRKHKWRRTKAHRASKTKHLNERNVKNRPHGQEIYVSTRLYRKGIRIIEPMQSYKFMPKPKLAKGFPTLRELRVASRTSRFTVGPIIDNRQVRQQKARTERAIVNAYNADADLGADLVNALIAIQDRELTPEDYELLLRLDERVKPKTIDDDIIKALPTSTITEEMLAPGSDELELCSVCLETYLIGQIRKHLPCGHIFHSTCIENWLNFSSQNCPLDGLPLDHH